MQLIEWVPGRRGALARVLLLLAALCAAAPSAAAGQGGATTGSIRGQVLDGAGQPVIGAVAVATNQETSLRRQVTTGETGGYLLPLLPPGRYTVRVQRIGYRPSEARDVVVRLGELATQNFRLEAATVELEAVTVQAERTLNVADASVTHLVTQEEIENLPVLGRDFSDFIRLSGLVAPNPEETTGGKFSIAGQRPSQTNIQIDGVDGNSGFFGENRGGSRIPFSFSLESIREFQVITNGFDVEYGNYSGGVVNVVTRGGTNRLEGTGYVNYRTDALTADDFAGNSPADYEVTQYAARVSGPIQRDRAFFLFSLDGQRRREPQVPLTVEGLATDPASSDSLERFLTVLESRYGVPDASTGYQQFQTTNDVLTLFGRVDWTINPRHRLSVRHNFSTYNNGDEFNETFDFIYGQSRAETLEDDAHSFVTELQSVLGQRTFNVFRFQFADEQRPRQGNDVRPALIVNLGTGQQAGYGGTFASFQNRLDERKFQLVDNLTHTIGAHTVKGGGNAIFSHVENQFILSGAGEYRFTNLAAFEAFDPASFTRNVGSNGEVPLSDFDVAEWSLYAQDEWRVTPKLTATFGLRWDVQSYLDDPSRVVEAEEAFGVETGIAPVDKDNLSPRLGVAYDLNGDGRSVARAGVGYFYGRVPYVVGGNVQSSVNPVLNLTCTGSATDLEPDAPPTPSPYGGWPIDGAENPGACAGGAGVGGVPTYTFWTTGFEYPETFKANLGYERLFGDRTRAAINLIYSRTTNLYTVRNINLRDPQFELATEGNRRVFQPAEVFNPAATSTDHLRNLDFGNVFVNYNDGRARSMSLALDVTHRLSPATALRGTYTYTSSQDNSSYSCCTATEGYTNATVGRFGPNDVGGVGDEDRAWGPSDFTRNHTFVLEAITRLPFEIGLSAFWRLQSGNPWSPEQSGDLNGDGVRFNDRPFIFAPEDLPLATTDPTEAQAQRDRYAGYLSGHACVGDHVGQIIPRNACRFPWFNRLDVRLSRAFATFGTQRAELQLDVFNVLNGIDSDWGRYMGVFAANRNILAPEGFDPVTGQILYSVPANFGQEEPIGANLLFQFQVQLAVRYYF